MNWKLLFQVFKFIFGGIIFGLSANAFFCYFNYYYLLENKYSYPLVLAIGVGLFFFIFYFILFPSYYRHLFKVEKIAKLMFISLTIIPFSIFYGYLYFLTLIYLDVSYDNKEIVKSGKFIVRTASRDVFNDDVKKYTRNFFYDVLDKQKVNTDKYSIEMKLDDNNKNYGSRFSVHVHLIQKNPYLSYYTFGVPFPKESYWVFYYRFAEGAMMPENVENVEELVSTVNKQNDKIQYSTPYGDFMEKS